MVTEMPRSVSIHQTILDLLNIKAIYSEENKYNAN